MAAALSCIQAYGQSKSFKLGQWTEIESSILKELNRSYVDSLPLDRIMRAGINAMLENLDPYTIYIPEEENEDLQMMLSKTYGGIGAIIFKEKGGNVIINEPYYGSPAWKNGLRCGDEILTIDGTETKGLETAESSDRMKGKPGTTVNFKVRKAIGGDTVNVSIVRERIHIPDVEYVGMVDDTTGYIKQTGFTDNVSDDIRAGYFKLKSQGMKRLVLDLRGNGGGLMNEAINVNYIDETEYPRVAVMCGRCINILANLWHTPEKNAWKAGAVGIGSSEACMLGGVAAWLRWRAKRKKEGKPYDKPNLVMSAAYQIVWEKFCQLWQIELRAVPISFEHPTLDAEAALKMCDENTICIVPIAGVTWTGLNDDVEALDRALDRYNKNTGYDIPIHVDAASGGFILPFTAPDEKWDFRLKWVYSISTSGHKFGLVYPGLGWVVWRDKSYLPDEMSFSVNYLGANITQVGLNFSRPAAQILGRYTRSAWTAAILPALWVVGAIALGAATGGLASPRGWIAVAGGAISLLAFWAIGRKRRNASGV